MNDRLQQIMDVQNQMLDHFGRKKIPATSGSVDHVVIVSDQLKSHLDAEMRHVTLSRIGLADALTRVFVESVCALMNRDLDLPDGRRKRVPMDLNRTCEILVHDVFAPKNQAYSNSFGDYGAVGVVIRLLDKAHDLRGQDHEKRISEPVSKSVAHIANYAVMAMILLIEDEPGFLS